MMNIFTLSGLINLIINPFLATVIYYSNRKSRMHRLWAVFIMSLTVWSLGAMKIGSIGVNPERFQESLFWWRVAHVGVVFLPVTFYHFIVAFLSLERPKSIRLAYAGGVFFTLLSATPLMIKTVRPLYDLFYYDVPGWIYPVFFLCFFAPYSMIPFIDLGRFIHRTLHGKRKLQAQWFFLATGIGWIGGTTNFLPVWGIDIHPYGNFACSLYPFLMAYAILQNRLMDVSVALTRTMVSLIVLSLPFAVGFFYQNELMMFLGTWWWCVPVVVMGVLAVFVPPTYLWFERWTEERFSQEKYRYQVALLSSLKTITRIRDVNKLSDYLVSVLTEMGLVTHAAIFLNQGNKMFVLAAQRNHPFFSREDQIDANSPLIEILKSKKEPLILEDLLTEERGKGNAESVAKLQQNLEQLESVLIVPLFMEHKLLGFITLGPKRSGFIYNAGDWDLFSTLANQAGLAIENAIVFSELMTTQAEVVIQKKNASIDTLTGFLLRRSFFEQVPLILKRLKIKSETGILMMIDLDHFKNQNDAHGHLAGDEILRKVSQRIASSLRDGDLCGRYGGEEFIVLLVNAIPAEAFKIAERFRKKISDQPIHFGGLVIPQTISIGVSIYPKDAEDLVALIEKADKALYSAKGQGRNTVCCYSPEGGK